MASVIVVDASVVVEWLIDGPVAGQCERRLVAHARQLCAPHLLDVEVASGMRKHVIGGRMTPRHARRRLGLYLKLRLDRYDHGPLLGRIFELRDNVSAYDAAYVALAEGLDAPLVTCDRRLAAAPGIRARVEVIS